MSPPQFQELGISQDDREFFSSPWSPSSMTMFLSVNVRGWTFKEHETLYYLIPDAVRDRYCTIRYS